jgi:hypothetical protein
MTPDYSEWDTNSPGAVLARIETKLDKSLTELGDHEVRLRAVEKKVWAASGFAAVLGGGGAAFLSRLLGG